MFFRYVQGNDNQILATYFRESLQEMIITENTDELEEFQVICCMLVR